MASIALLFEGQPRVGLGYIVLHMSVLLLDELFDCSSKGGVSYQVAGVGRHWCEAALNFVLSLRAGVEAL